MKKFLAFLLVATMMIPTTVFADTDKTVQVPRLEFTQIEEEVSTYNAQYRKIEDSFDDVNNSVHSGSQAIKAAEDAISDLQQRYIADHVSGADPTLDEAILALLESQKRTLSSQMGSLPDVQNLKQQGDKGKDQIVAGVQSLFISYNSIGRQLEELRASMTLLETQMEVMKIRVELGMDSQLNLDATEYNFKTLYASTQALQNTHDNLKHQLNLAFAQEYDAEIEIGENPRVEAEEIALIDVASDFLEAQNNSYDIESSKDEYDYVLGDAYRQFENSFYELYENVKTKQRALEAEELNLKTAKINSEILELRNKLGIVSSIQYEQEKMQYQTVQNKYATVQDELFIAYNNYQWAKKGLILGNSLATR
ncbi:TolC family protein [Desulfitobacterium sp. THU1]|uniref:TolC family protein n=1 Tax=Desulfitobacterium sp. THU1 TaxID=3138072 RepID=UPI00311D9F2B